AEVDVSGLEVLAEGTHQRESSYSPGNYVSNGDAAQTPGEGDGQRFGEKLEENVSLVRAQRLLDADFAGTLLHRDQHDVHQPDAANAQGQSADEGEQNL